MTPVSMLDLGAAPAPVPCRCLRCGSPLDKGHLAIAYPATGLRGRGLLCSAECAVAIAEDVINDREEVPEALGALNDLDGIDNYLQALSNLNREPKF